ncbi:MAG: hypothetical protein K8R74_17915 [Bacteroidales bacterium]|nr:hypothetical protein [Bacteroidales bacterium]
MENNSNIKWSLIWSNLWIVGIVYFVTYVAEGQLLNTHYSGWIWGAILIFFGVYYYWKLKLIHFFILGFVLGLGSWHFEAAEHLNTIFSPVTLIIHLVLIFITLFTTIPKINKAVKLEIQARNLFRLAAQQVFDVSNGFTNRPYSGGKTDADRNEILGLARFLAGKEILMYDAGPDMVTYAFSMNTSPLIDPQMNRVSYVSFDKDGNISVHISKKDYKQYKNKLSFDQLCASFANMFKQFLEYYKDGNEDRIITELKSV